MMHLIADRRDYRARVSNPSLVRPAEPLYAAGSHMPLDVDGHWSWRNPLNLIPAFIGVVMLVALFALLLG